MYAGKLLHLITVLEILLLLILAPLILNFDARENILLVILKYYALIYLLSLPVFAQLDARSRYQNFKQIRDQIILYGFSYRILKPVLKSRCQRDAAWYAAKEAGYAQPCKDFFFEKGYRWYHLFPDFVFQKPQFLFTYYFWRTTFFAPCYIPKVPFTEYHTNESSVINAEKTACATN